MDPVWNWKHIHSHLFEDRSRTAFPQCLSIRVSYTRHWFQLCILEKRLKYKKCKELLSISQNSHHFNVSTVVKMVKYVEFLGSQEYDFFQMHLSVLKAIEFVKSNEFLL